MLESKTETVSLVQLRFSATATVTAERVSGLRYSLLLRVCAEARFQQILRYPCALATNFLPPFSKKVSQNNSAVSLSLLVCLLCLSSARGLLMTSVRIPGFRGFPLESSYFRIYITQFTKKYALQFVAETEINCKSATVPQLRHSNAACLPTCRFLRQSLLKQGQRSVKRQITQRASWTSSHRTAYPASCPGI